MRELGPDELPEEEEFDLDVSDGAIQALLDQVSVIDEEELAEEGPAPSPAVRELNRRLMGQQVDLIASLGRQIFRSRNSGASQQQLQKAIEPLARMSEGAADGELLGHLRALPEPVEDPSGTGRAAHRSYLRQLHDWVVGLTPFLDEEDAERLRSIFVYQKTSIPLLEELRELRGIGPKRIERLYCAGLYTVDAVGDADPIELAQVTGLPPKLARKVVRATRAFAARQRREMVEGLHRRVAELRRLLRRSDAPLGSELGSLVEEAYLQLREGMELLAAEGSLTARSLPALEEPEPSWASEIPGEESDT